MVGGLRRWRLWLRSEGGGNGEEGERGEEGWEGRKEAWEVYVGNVGTVECERGGEMKVLAGVKRSM